MCTGFQLMSVWTDTIPWTSYLNIRISIKFYIYTIEKWQISSWDTMFYISFTRWQSKSYLVGGESSHYLPYMFKVKWSIKLSKILQSVLNKIVHRIATKALSSKYAAILWIFLSYPHSDSSQMNLIEKYKKNCGMTQICNQLPSYIYLSFITSYYSQDH